MGRGRGRGEEEKDLGGGASPRPMARREQEKPRERGPMSAGERLRLGVPARRGAPRRRPGTDFNPWLPGAPWVPRGGGRGTPSRGPICALANSGRPPNPYLCLPNLLGLKGRREPGVVLITDLEFGGAGRGAQTKCQPVQNATTHTSRITSRLPPPPMLLDLPSPPDFAAQVLMFSSNDF